MLMVLKRIATATFIFLVMFSTTVSAATASLDSVLSTIKANYANKKFSTYFSSVRKADLGNILELASEYSKTNPYFYSLDAVKTVTDERYFEGSSTAKITVTYKMYMTEAQRLAAMEDIKQATMKTVYSDMSPREKVEAINNYMAATFDYPSYIEQQHFYLPHFIENKVGVCQAYMHYAGYMALYAGLEAKPVTGIANGENHGWVNVKIDGQWLHFDPTYNDPQIVVPFTKYYTTGTVATTTHLLVTDAELKAEGRTWKDNTLYAVEKITPLVLNKRSPEQLAELKPAEIEPVVEVVPDYGVGVPIAYRRQLVSANTIYRVLSKYMHYR